MENNEEKNVGGIVGTIIIVLVLLAGAYYFFSQKIVKLETQKQTATSTVMDVSDLSTSTDVTAIEEDLGKIDMKVLDQQ